MADAETEAPIVWPPDAKRQLIRKDSDAGKDRRQEEKGTTENEMAGGPYASEQGLGDGEGKGSLECWSL